MVLEATGVLDLWTILIEYVFGGFWIAVIGLAALMFIIMGVLGRMSPYTLSIYLVMFLIAMTMGYGFILLSVVVETILLISFMLAVKAYFDRS